MKNDDCDNLYGGPDSGKTGAAITQPLLDK